MNSREKGKRGERQWRDELRANGFAARRGQQFAGSAESPDVVCEALGWMHFEVKLVERLDLYAAMEQARRDCGGRVPVVAHRRNFWPWLVTMEAERFYRHLRRDLTGAWAEEMAGAPPAVACAGLGWACCVVQEGRRLSVHEAMARAERSAGGRAVVFAHRRPGGRWLITVTAETFFRLLRGDFTEANEANEGNHFGDGAQGLSALPDDRDTNQETKGKAV